MKTSRTALAAAAFGVAAMIAPVSAEETKYNFSSEFSNRTVAADGRTESAREAALDRGNPTTQAAQYRTSYSDYYQTWEYLRYKWSRRGRGR